MEYRVEKIKLTKQQFWIFGLFWASFISYIPFSFIALLYNNYNYTLSLIVFISSLIYQNVYNNRTEYVLLNKSGLSSVYSDELLRQNDFDISWDNIKEIQVHLGRRYVRYWIIDIEKQTVKLPLESTNRNRSEFHFNLINFAKHFNSSIVIHDV
jgi:hypothetical protein